MDVNEAATSEWVAETDGFERVRSVVRQTRDPASAAEIADRARVSETTARKHLERLVDLGAAAEEREGRTTRYRRDADHHVVRRIRELQREHSRSELLESIREMKAEIRAFREEYGVESPEELAIGLEGDDVGTLGDGDDASASGHRTEPETEGPDEPWDVIAEWEATRENLSLAQTALAYDRTRDLVAAR